MISLADMAQIGELALCAEDMYDASNARRLPDDPRIAAVGWDIIGYFQARDVILPADADLVTGEKKTMRRSPVMVYFGYLARSQADATKHAAVLRGTAGFAEWIIDAEFIPIPYGNDPAKSVEQGFWGIFDTMQLIDRDGRLVDAKAANGLASVLGEQGAVVVAGHSLGSALATYLSLATALLAPGRVSAAMFASPHPGNKAFADYYDQVLGGGANYLVVNYALDAVPCVPFSTFAFNYSPLNHVFVLTPHGAKADIKCELGCNHHLVCYLAMLDYAFEQNMAKQKGDQALCDQCILGPATPDANDVFADLASRALGYFPTPDSLTLFARRLGWKPV